MYTGRSAAAAAVVNGSVQSGHTPYTIDGTAVMYKYVQVYFCRIVPWLWCTWYFVCHKERRCNISRCGYRTMTRGKWHACTWN